MAAYTVGQLARLSGAGVETIRYYEREGLIAEPPRRPSGYRQYPEDALARLRFIRHAKALGFSLKDIKELLSLRVTPGTTCADIRQRAEVKIVDIRAKIVMLRQMEQALVGLAASCHGDGPTSTCSILDALEGDS
ncbi:MAG: heavy metal-responsive transcriptional regulator [Gammaproteobacteria bacterium]|nr:heavy metal-responsive transcriptional regulator [Gammaproteobacteria bacterium]